MNRRMLPSLMLLVALPSATWAQSWKCKPREVTRATVPEIAAHPEKFMGNCVIIDGVMRAPFLYESVDGVYLRSPESLSPSASGFKLGLDRVSKYSFDGYRHVSIVGRVQDCEAIRELVYANVDLDNFVMIRGYCHHFNGAYVNVHDLRTRKGPRFFRQMGDKQREDYGDLMPAPGDWPLRSMVQTQADKFLAALRAADHDTLANLHFRDVGLEWPDDEAEMLNLLLEDRRSPFASLRAGTSTPQQIMLIARDLEEADQVADNFSVHVCYCRSADCAGKWPIASFDADNLPSRPYACTYISSYYDDGKSLVQFTSGKGRGGLVEPD